MRFVSAKKENEVLQDRKYCEKLLLLARFQPYNSTTPKATGSRNLYLIGILCQINAGTRLEGTCNTKFFQMEE